MVACLFRLRRETAKYPRIGDTHEKRMKPKADKQRDHRNCGQAQEEIACSSKAVCIETEREILTAPTGLTLSLLALF